MADPIKAGDVVKVRSGGPDMTVSNVDQDVGGVVTAWCHWFADNSNPHTGTFPVVVLDKSGP